MMHLVARPVTCMNMLLLGARAARTSSSNDTAMKLEDTCRHLALSAAEIFELRNPLLLLTLEAGLLGSDRPLQLQLRVAV